MVKHNENLKGETIIYKEIVKLSKRITILIIVILVTSFILTLTLSIIFPPIVFLLIIIFFIVDTTALILYANYRRLVISISDNEISLKFGIFNDKTIPFELIHKYEIIKPKFLTFGGVGVKIGLDGSWAYITDFKQALKVEYKEHRTFVFSTRYPEKIIEIIKSNES
ncbi:MAG: hypothetical protein EU548_09745 [Promethearchaeota archaeon]|nr:MAG: hypothetical protein EU548_09745 [Candidatus Lokiarchaeota archaeon]